MILLSDRLPGAASHARPIGCRTQRLVIARSPPDQTHPVEQATNRALQLPRARRVIVGSVKTQGTVSTTKAS